MMTSKPALPVDADIAKRMPPAPAGEALLGGRAALPQGSLSRTYLEPQGDEQRDPPAGAPSPVPPAPTVGREVRPMPAPRRVGE